MWQRCQIFGAFVKVFLRFQSGQRGFGARLWHFKKSSDSLLHVLVTAIVGDEIFLIGIDAEGLRWLRIAENRRKAVYMINLAECKKFVSRRGAVAVFPAIDGFFFDVDVIILQTHDYIGYRQTL